MIARDHESFFFWVALVSMPPIYSSKLQCIYAGASLVEDSVFGKSLTKDAILLLVIHAFNLNE